MIKRNRQKRRKTNRANNAEYARESLRKYNKLGLENVEGFSREMLMKKSPSAVEGSRVNSPGAGSSNSSKKREKLGTANSKTSSNSSQVNKGNNQRIETVRFNEDIDISAIRANTQDSNLN